MSAAVRPLVCFLFAALIHGVSAQQGGEGASMRKPTRQAWFIQTSIPSGVDNPVKVLAGNEIHLLTMSNRVSSGPIAIPADGVIRLVKEVPDPNDPLKVTYRVLATAEFEKSVVNALVIMTPVPEPAEDGPLFLTKVQSLADFKGGDYLYINMTSARVGVEIGEGKMILDPGSMKIYDVDGGDTLQSVPYRHSYYHPRKKRWMPLNASMTIVSPTRREVFIFSINNNTGRIRCKGVTVPVS